MKKELFKLLEQFEYEYVKQGALSEGERYPDNFFTWNNPYTEDDEVYDNFARKTIWEFDVAFYSTDPVLVDEVIKELRKKALSAGHYVNGKGYEVDSGRKSHSGRVITIEMKETNYE
jgi:hypothetical protein